MAERSPFPGMDPYLEACGLWEGFHGHLIEAIYQAIATVLPRGYTVDTAVRSYVVLMGANGKDERLVKPDVGVTDPSRRKRPGKRRGNVAVAAPGESGQAVPMRAFIAERFREAFVEIHAEDEERSLVTCLEVLSPTNKRRGSEGWLEYERKRQALLLGRANFVEIDLLRGGTRFPMIDPWPETPYALLVCRQVDAPLCQVYPAHLRQPLPVIPVPLREPDPDLTLDLQSLVDRIYAVGRYGERLDYTRKLTPALPDEDAAWVRKRLAR